MFLYKATLNPTSVFSLSVCTRLVAQSSEKKAPAYKKLSGNDSRPPSLVCKATAANSRSFYCIYMV